MDEKLSKALKAILANLCVEYAEKGEIAFSDWLPQTEQAFRDAGWIEPQQPEGELARCPCLAEGCLAAMCSVGCVVKQGMEAQLAHDKATMVKPSEGRIEEMLKQGKRVRLWYGQRFLDRDTISHEWVVMDSQGNKGLGCSLYVGSDLDKALDALEGEGK